MKNNPTRPPKDASKSTKAHAKKPAPKPPKGKAATASKSRPVLADEARGLLAKDLENLRLKVGRGAVLTPSERRLLASTLDASAPTSGFAANQVELAGHLGVTRQTIHRWLREPGNPGSRPDGRYCLAEWSRWSAERGGGPVGSPTSTELKSRLIGVQIEKIEHALSVARGEFYPVVDVKKWCAELATAIRKVVTQIHLVAPSVVGVSVQEAETRLKDVEDEVLLQLRAIGQPALPAVPDRAQESPTLLAPV